MKYNLFINQRAVYEHFRNELNIIDCVVLDVVTDLLLNHSKLTTTFSNGKIFVWCKPSLILKQCPLLNIGEKQIKNIINRLCDLGLLQKSDDNQATRMYFVAIGDKYELLTSDKKTYQDNTEISPLGNKFTSKKISYNNTINSYSYNTKEEEEKKEEYIYTETAENDYDDQVDAFGFAAEYMAAELTTLYLKTAEEEEPYVLPEWVNSTAADQLYNDSKFIQNNGRKEKETEVLSSAQNASDNSSAKKKKVDYTPEFEAMWLTYGNKRNKQESFIAFKKLAPEQQAQMIEFVKMYITVRTPEYRRNMDRLIEKEEYDILYEEIERAYKAKHGGQTAENLTAIQLRSC